MSYVALIDPKSKCVQKKCNDENLDQLNEKTDEKIDNDKEDLVENPVNFISISREDRTKISYLTVDRISNLDVSEYWTSSWRFQIKPGGFISKLFKNVSSKEVEKFSNLFRTQSVKPKFNFSIVKGESIKQYYHHSSYQDDRGTLGSSCMKHDSCQKYLGLYVENDDKIKMLVMTDDFGNLMGRTLLWQFDSYKIMDRIYTVCDEDLSFHFKQWATQNGYLYKSEQNWYNTLQFEQIGQKKQELKLEVSLNESEFRYYPYMDTFKFFNPDTGTFSNYRPDGRDHYTLCSSDGSKYDWNYLEYDDFEKVYRHRGETVRLHYLDMNAHPDRCNYSNIMDQYILCEHSQWREDIEDYVFIGAYSDLNDNERIKQRLKDMEEYEKQRATRRSRRSSSLSQELIEAFHNSENSIDTLSLYQQYVDQITTEFLSRQIEPTEE